MATKEQEEAVGIVRGLLGTRYTGVAWTDEAFGGQWRALRSAGGYEVLVDERGRCVVNRAPHGERLALTKYLMGRPEGDKRAAPTMQFFRPKAAV